MPSGHFRAIEILRELSLMEKLLESGLTAESRAISNIEKEASAETVRIRTSTGSTDFDGVMTGVHQAQRNRVDKLEHEMMSKLVSKMRDRTELDSLVSAVRDSISRLHADAESLTQTSDSRRSRTLALQQMIASVEESLLHDPAPEDLPPLEEVDPRLFSIV